MTTPNIGRAGQQKRRGRGYALFGLSGATWLVMVAANVPSAFLALLFLPLLLASLYVLQAREKT